MFESSSWNKRPLPSPRDWPTTTKAKVSQMMPLLHGGLFPSKVGGHSRPPLKIPVPKTWVNLGLAGDSITSIDGAVSREIGDTMTAVTDHHPSHWRFRRCRTGQQR